MLYIRCLYLFLGHFNHIFKIRIMLTNLFSSMGTTLLRLCLPLNHKHNTDPPKLPARCQTDSHNLASPKAHPPKTVSDTRTQCPKPFLNTRTQNSKPNLNTNTPYQSLNYSRPALKTKNPATEVAGLFLRENLLRVLTNPSQYQQPSDTQAHQHSR